MNEWISVKDRLPENKERWVLGVIEEIEESYATIVAYFKDGWIDNYGDRAKVTHWMPLPKPPEVED